MKSIKELWEDFKENQRKSKHRRIEMRANELFQVVERDGQLWFVHQSALFCPCSMICKTEDNKAVVEFLNSVRQLYIERHGG